MSRSATPNGGADAFNRMEFKRYLHDQLLRDTDVFSMAHSVEARVPFLDHELVEFATRLPSSWKLKDTVGKSLLKKAALALPKIAESIAGKKIRKVVIVPNKLVNIATN